MRTISKIQAYRLQIKAALAQSMCQEKAVDCAYAALAAALEDKAWQRNRYQNLMRRFRQCSNVLEAWTGPTGEKTQR